MDGDDLLSGQFAGFVGEKMDGCDPLDMVCYTYGMRDRVIWIFDSEVPKTPVISRDGARIIFFSTAQMLADINKLEGLRPHLIVNLVEPSVELFHRQRMASVVNDAPIIPLFYV